MAQVVSGHPLDTIKVRVQLEGASGRFKGPMDCLVSTVRQEGVLGLYKGMASPLVGISAVNSLLFAAYSRLKQWQSTSKDAVLPLDRIALAGAGAGAINSVLASPVELLKIRLQTQYASAGEKTARAYSGPMDCARKLVQQDGLAKGLYRGFWATVAREIPAYASFYAGFEMAKRAWCPEGQEASVAQLVGAGAFAGVCYWTCCYPLDAIKSKAQCGTARLGRGYMLEIARTMFRSGGLRVFFNGFTPTLVRSAPAAGATFATYELVMRALAE